MSTTTYMAKPGEVQREWLIVDAQDKVLGRLAAEIALLLQGKHKPTYTPHVDTGAFVIVLNADKVRLTGRKSETQEYDTYSYYPSGRRVYSYQDMIAKHPERVVELTVRRMLPKNKLGKHMFTKLKCYRGTEHPHSAQQPKPHALAI